MTVAPTAAALVAAAKEAAGVTTDEALARYVERRYGIKVAQSTVYRWGNDANGPGYAATIAMLDLVGWLRLGAAELETAGGVDLSADPLGEIAKTLKTLAWNQSIALDALGVPAAERLPVQQPDEPKKARPKRK